MLKATLLAIALAGLPLLGQQATASANENNDLTKTLAACGKPAKESVRPAHGLYGQEHDLTYRGVTLTFTDTLPDSWVLFSVKRPKHALVYGSSALPEARRLLPCLPNLNEKTINPDIQSSQLKSAADDESTATEIVYEIALLIGVGLLVLYLIGQRRIREREEEKHRTQASRVFMRGENLHINLPKAHEDDLVRRLQALAVESQGAVQVQIPAGQRARPNQMEIVALKVPQLTYFGLSFISARATVDHVVYGFHGHLRDSSPVYGDPVYFTITGPDRESRELGEFEIGSDFRWGGHERPLNPKLVKYALQAWINQPEVRELIERVRRSHTS